MTSTTWMNRGARLPRWLVMALVAALLTAVAGCSGDDVDAEPSIGQSERTESVRALGMALVTDGDGVARFVGTLLNEAEETDRLVGVDIDTEIGPFALVFAEGPILLQTDEPFRLAREGEVLVVSDKLRKGFRVELTLVFRNSAPIVTTVPVESQTGPYADVEITRPLDGSIAP
jgi:hypothetical protein